MRCRPAKQGRPRQACAFTLIELLTVIAIMGILASILIPTTAAVQVSSRRARTKVLFSQWAGAMEQFRQEYGYYPAVDGGTGKLDTALFAAALTGKGTDGRAITDDAALAGNARRACFYAVAESDLNEARTALVDAFGNTDIGVLYDRDGDGRVTGADGEIHPVTGPGGTFQPDSTVFDPVVGVRAGVIFYSAGRGSEPGDLVLSWK